MTTFETIALYKNSKLFQIVEANISRLTQPIVDNGSSSSTAIETTLFLDANPKRFMILLDCLRDGMLPSEFKDKQQEEFMHRDIQKWGPFKELGSSYNHMQKELETTADKQSQSDSSQYMEEDLQNFNSLSNKRQKTTEPHLKLGFLESTQNSDSIIF